MNEKEVERILNYCFKDKGLLKRALTHSSYFNERQENYQKLEFFGDSILDFAVAEYLYREYSEKSEGDLTRMRANVVSKTALAELVAELGIDRYAYIGRAQNTMSAKMRSDLYEAVVAAMYIDGGLEAAQSFIFRTVIPKLSEEEGDFKSKILEYAAKRKAEVRFEDSSEGPSHKKRFFSTVIFEGSAAGKGEGYSITEAHQKAAKAALKKIQ